MQLYLNFATHWPIGNANSHFRCQSLCSSEPLLTPCRKFLEGTALREGQGRHTDFSKTDHRITHVRGASYETDCVFCLWIAHCVSLLWGGKSKNTQHASRTCTVEEPFSDNLTKNDHFQQTHLIIIIWKSNQVASSSLFEQISCFVLGTLQLNRPQKESPRQSESLWPS
jgi:hypothetical protein